MVQVKNGLIEQFSLKEGQGSFKKEKIRSFFLFETIIDSEMRFLVGIRGKYNLKQLYNTDLVDLSMCLLILTECFMG